MSRSEAKKGKKMDESKKKKLERLEGREGEFVLARVGVRGENGVEGSVGSEEDFERRSWVSLGYWERCERKR